MPMTRYYDSDGGDITMNMYHRFSAFAAQYAEWSRRESAELNERASYQRISAMEYARVRKIMGLSDDTE